MTGLNSGSGTSKSPGLSVIPSLGGSGLGGNESDIQYPPVTFDFTQNGATIPTGWTYTRSDSNIATYRNSSGQLQVAAANTARFNYDISGNPLGMRMEGTRVNVCTNQNAVISATTNITVTGDATITTVADASAITAYKCGTVVTNNVFEAAGGILGGTVVIAGTTAQTALKVSAQLVAWDTVSTGASFGITPLPTNTAIAGATPTLYFANNMTATANTDTLVITIPAGVTIHFMLNQLETGPSCSSVIKIAGAAATRQNEVFGDLSITTRSYFRISQGAIIGEVSFDNILTNGADSQILLTAGTGLTSGIGVGRQAGATRSKCFWRGVIASTNELAAIAPNEAGVDAALQRYPVAVSWINGSTMLAAAAACTFGQVTPSASFTGIDRLYVGCRAFTEMMFGHILTIKIYKNYRPIEKLGLDMIRVGDIVYPTRGQSNMTDWFTAQSGSNNTGERTAKATIDTSYGVPATINSPRRFLMNGGTVGTSVLYISGTSTDLTYWYDPATGNYGLPFRRCISITQGCGNATFADGFDTSGESDAGNCTIQQFEDGLTTIWSVLRGYMNPNVRVFNVNIGTNSGVLNGYQTIRESDWKLYVDYSTVFYRIPERIYLARSDSIHLTDASAGILAGWAARKLLSVNGQSVSGGVDGPLITNVSRITTAVTVTISHDAGGTDFTPTSAINGFKYFNGSDYNAAANVITNAVRLNATTITLTLTSSSAGTLYYGLGSLSTETQANLVRDNSTQTLPLQTSKWTVT